jgi:hypothetical protein
MKTFYVKETHNTKTVNNIYQWENPETGIYSDIPIVVGWASFEG